MELSALYKTSEFMTFKLSPLRCINVQLTSNCGVSPGVNVGGLAVTLTLLCGTSLAAVDGSSGRTTV